MNSPPLTFLEPGPGDFSLPPSGGGGGRAGGTACAILNGANEEAVRLFLAEKIGFYDISDLVAAARATVPVTQTPSLEEILSADHAAREAVKSAFARETFMSFVYILAAILIFGVLIAVHELGHFLAAKLCGVQVNEFSIGMGPAVWHRKKGETAYSFRILPIGGYCAMEGRTETRATPGLHPSGLLEKNS